MEEIERPANWMELENPAAPGTGGCGDCKMTAAERKRMEEIKAAGRSGSDTPRPHRS